MPKSAPNPVPNPEIARKIEEQAEASGSDPIADRLRQDAPEGESMLEGPEPQQGLAIENNGNSTEDEMTSQSEKTDDKGSTAESWQQPKQDLGQEQPSVIGASLVVKGEVEAAEDLVIEGRLEGSIRHTSERLIIGRSGTVQARIEARNLTIEGTVDGDIVGSESVVILETAKVSGNIYTPRISIADGAQFNGSVEMEVSSRVRH